MIIKLKQLIQILSISFFITFVFNYKLAHSSSTCNFYTEDSLKLKNQNYPKLIEITTPNSKKWFIKTLKSVGERRVNKQYKKYQKANFKITFSNNLICTYEGKIRIHGGRVDHIDVEKLNSSIRVKIEDGHLNNKYNFALIKKNTTSFENEIFASTFFEILGYLSGLNYKIKVILNGSKIEEFLFREIPTLEMAKDSNRNNGIFLQSNKNNFENLKTQVPYTRSIVLNRVKNSDGIEDNNVNTILYALDKLNYLYLNSLGIGDGKNCCSEKLKESNISIKNLYNEGIYPLNFSIFDDEIEIERNSIFNILMNAINATHGLQLEDRGFYYDPTFDRFEPFYRDGDARIVKDNNFDKELIQLFNFEKKYINNTIEMINNIDIENLKTLLSKKGLELDELSLKNIIDDIIQNINIMKSLRLYDNHENNLTKNYFKNHFDKRLNFNLAFGGINNKFEICDIKLENCKYLIMTDKQKITLLNDKWLTLESYVKPIMYVRLSKEDYVNNSKPKKRGLKKFKKFYVNDDFIIFYDTPNESILIDNDKNRIVLKQTQISNKFIFYGNNIKNWKIKFEGADENLKDTIPYKRDENMIGGCVTFVNSKFENISFENLNNKCSKGIEILNSEGSFEEIIITKSILDAFDAEFSKISINKILIQGAMGECIGLKRGEYQIDGAILNDCLDHSISVGEHGVFEGKKIYVNNNAGGKYGKSRYHQRVGFKGIMAKDSSKITLHEYKNISSRKCILSLRKKNNYDGALVKIKKNKFSCSIVNGLSKDNYSSIEFF